jgi:hypothetical protein
VPGRPQRQHRELFNPIQVYTCNGTNAQQWTVESNGTLQVLGMCLDVDAAGTANGTLVDLYTCNGTGAQVWEPQSNGELLNPNSGKCLDDTGYGGSGTQVQIWACADTSNQQWTLPTGSTATHHGARRLRNTPHAGLRLERVRVHTSMSTTTIQNDINAVYNTQQSNQFGTQRYELMFEPGTYNVSVPVGFYTEVVGLGQSPTQTVITGGGIYANAAWNDGNATENFWRGVENITIDPSSGSTEWAVSQADPMRRVQIDGNRCSTTTPRATPAATGRPAASSATRSSPARSTRAASSSSSCATTSSAAGPARTGTWCSSATPACPGQSFPSPPDTTVGQTPTVDEKPYLYIDSSGNWDVFVPSNRTNATGRLLGERQHAGNLAADQRLLHRDAEQHGRADQRGARGRARTCCSPRASTRSTARSTSPTPTPSCSASAWPRWCPTAATRSCRPLTSTASASAA